MEPLDFCIGTNLSLAFLKNCTISYGLGKVPQKYLKNYVHFLRLRMNLAMKKKSIDKNNYIIMSTTSILRVGKK
jgi:hypothetical protein